MLGGIVRQLMSTIAVDTWVLFHCQLHKAVERGHHYHQILWIHMKKIDRTTELRIHYQSKISLTSIDTPQSWKASSDPKKPSLAFHGLSTEFTTRSKYSGLNVYQRPQILAPILTSSSSSPSSLNRPVGKKPFPKVWRRQWAYLHVLYAPEKFHSRYTEAKM